MGAVWIERIDHFSILGNRGDRLLINFFDHIPFSQFAGCITDTRNDHPAHARWNIEAARQIRRQFPHLNSGKRSFVLLIIFIGCARGLRWLWLVWLARRGSRRQIIDRLFLYLRRHFHGFATAIDFQLHLFVQFHLRNEAA